METEEQTLTIGRAAQQSGLTPKAIRLYETRGLISEPDRTQSGYRTYTGDDVAILSFIRQARAVGLKLAEIKRVLDLQQSGAQPCGTVLSIVDGRVREIDEKMADLRSLRATLVRVRDSARESRKRGDEAVVCRLIESENMFGTGPVG
ncbi:MAG: MerR family DNA-binding protein [Thermoleophilaceae bacterium]